MHLSQRTLGGGIKDKYHLCLVFQDINVNQMWLDGGLDGNLFLGLLKIHTLTGGAIT